MSRVQSLIDKLSQHHPKGFDLSLDRILVLLEKLGNPQHKIPSAFHVAGTNGKGSTIAFLRAILEAGEKSVHVHTSPHLVRWNERYRLAGNLVDDDRLSDAIERVAAANGRQSATVFELLSAVMFVLFSEHKADHSLVEVGLGGRLDATNVIDRPLVSLITPISMDHQAYLGDTIEKIAAEKGGIIKQDGMVVVARQEDSVRDVLDEISRTQRAQCLFSGQDFDAYADQGRLVFQDENGLMDLPMPALRGEHQIENAALAIAAIRMADCKLADNAFDKAMTTVTWPGRMERLQDGKLTDRLSNADIWIDGGHNPSAGLAIAAEIIKMNTVAPRKTLMICGMINTKEPSGFFAPFSQIEAEVITVPVAMSEAGIPPQQLSEVAVSCGLHSTPANSLEDGIANAARRLSRQRDLRILFCGSLYMVGEVLEKNETLPQ
ncbi:MAG: folylpolyglutamate synthase/dihydrofolate synthase family protein [Pseudomonadota bacterium]